MYTNVYVNVCTWCVLFIYSHIQMYMWIYVHGMHTNVYVNICTWHSYLCYAVAATSRLLKIISLFCKRDLYKRRYSAKETNNFEEPTNRSHPICIYIYTYICIYIMYICSDTHLQHLCMCIHVVYMCSSIHSHLYVDVNKLHMYVYICIYMYRKKSEVEREKARVRERERETERDRERERQTSKNTNIHSHICVCM